MEKNNRTFTDADMLTGRYWQSAAKCFADTRMLIFAALIVALRVVVKFFKIPIAEGLSLTLDCYVNSVGSVIYGPLVALAVGAVSDTLGCIVAPTGAYFLPFILVEMSSGFIFALFLWRKKITLSRVIWSKFTVNLFCNILLTSLFMKWQYLLLYGSEKTYNLINLVRIGKNLVLFPLEAGLIALIFQTLLPALSHLNLIPRECAVSDFNRSRILLQIALSLVISVGIILLYVFWGRDFLAANNIKLL